MCSHKIPTLALQQIWFSSLSSQDKIYSNANQAPEEKKQQHYPVLRYNYTKKKPSSTTQSYVTTIQVLLGLFVFP